MQRRKKHADGCELFPASANLVRAVLFPASTNLVRAVLFPASANLVRAVLMSETSCHRQGQKRAPSDRLNSHLYVSGTLSVNNVNCFKVVVILQWVDLIW